MVDVAPTVVVPELFRLTGGVQVFSRYLIEALDAIYDAPVPVISRNDRRSDCPPDFLEGRRFYGCGFFTPGLRRFALIAGCLKNRSNLFVSSHPHFAPWLRIQNQYLNRPFICVAHGIDVWNIAGSKVAKGLRDASCLLPVSTYTSVRMKEQVGALRSPVKVFPNTFDNERFCPGPINNRMRDFLRIKPDAPLILSICRLSKGEEGKGYDRVLESIPELLISFPNLVWVLGGTGDDLERVKSRAGELGILGHCRFPGFVPDSEIVDLYRSADLFVLPSKKEGFGIVFLEAAACGLPVIAGNRDGSVDALAEGTLGNLIDPDSQAELVSAIRNALKSNKPDENKLHAMCVERFGKKAFQNRLRSVLNEFTPCKPK
ncbi:glycosyltransferase family 4 protein [Puniceicoccaceae bacterium K14]|nr:glycosyltransferase family 4 protein [Puniceicoccaceae bacterium K14]